MADIDNSIARVFLCPSWRVNVPGYDILTLIGEFDGIHAALEGQWRLKRCRLDEFLQSHGPAFLIRVVW